MYKVDSFCLVCRHGPNKWRDVDLPSEILDDWIESNGLPEAKWSGDKKTVAIGDEVHTLGK